MAAGGGGAWKVAYADFVTAMMAFFLVMWLVSQNKPAKEAIAEYFRNPNKSSGRGGGLWSKKDGVPPPTPKASQKSARERDSRGAGDQPIRVSENNDPEAVLVRKPSARMVLREGDEWSVGNTIPFATASSTLDERSTTALRTLLPQLLGKPNRIEIRGHCTGRPLPADSPFQDAWQLCYARCLTIKNFLEENGIEPERLRLSQAAAYEPTSRSTDPSLQANNSRVDVHLLGEFIDAYKSKRVFYRKRPDRRREDAEGETPAQAETAPATSHAAAEAQH